MSIPTATAVGSGTALSSAWAGIAARIANWWAGYMARRIEQAAIACLSAMTDRELRDIGLTRGEIATAVRRGWPNIPRR